MRTLKVTIVRSARFQHGRAVTAVVMTRDGRTIVTGGDDGRIRVWDGATGLLHRTIAVHTASISCLALTPDERVLVSGDEAGHAAVTELDGGPSEIRSVFDAPHAWPLRAVVVTASGTIVCTAGSFEQRHELYGDRDDPAQVRAFESIDELRRAMPERSTNTSGRLVHAFDDRSVVPTLRSRGDEVWVLDGTGHALRARAPELAAWERSEAPPEDRHAMDAWERASASGTPPVVAIRGDAVLCADGSYSCGDRARKLAFPPESFAFALGPAGTIVVGTKLGVLASFEPTSDEPRLFDDIHPAGIRSLAVTERYALTGGIDGRLRVWDLARRELIALSTGDPPDAVHAIAANATHAVSANRAGATTLWLLPSLEAPARSATLIKKWWGQGPMAVDASSESVAQATMTEVVVWQPKTGELTARIKTGFAVEALAFLPNGSLLVLEASAESKLRVFRGEKELAHCGFEGRATTMSVETGAVRVGFSDGAVMSVAL